MKASVERPLNLASEKQALLQARLVIANSERTRSDLIDGVGVAKERVRTIYYGIDAECFVPVEDALKQRARRELGFDQKPKVAFIGALSDRRKGFDTLFNAWLALCGRSDWDAELIVVGQGTELSSFAVRALDAGLGHRIQFMGFRDDVPRILAACDALVAPTRYEAFGLGVQEALCTGLPSIVSRSAGVAERYSDALSPLLLDDPESESELVQRLLRWRSEMAHWRTHTLDLAAQLRRRTWDVMADDILAAIDAG
jgi:glycosyltransferase involved in cell wall biosynthesis